MSTDSFDENKIDDVENSFLDDSVKNATQMTVFLSNGVKLNGIILANGSRTILLSAKVEKLPVTFKPENPRRNAQLLYKVNIASIVPMNSEINVAPNRR